MQQPICLSLRKLACFERQHPSTDVSTHRFTSDESLNQHVCCESPLLAKSQCHLLQYMNNLSLHFRILCRLQLPNSHQRESSLRGCTIPWRRLSSSASELSFGRPQFRPAPSQYQLPQPRNQRYSCVRGPVWRPICLASCASLT